MGNEYLTTMKPVFRQKLPKKMLRTQKIRVNKDYECLVSFWIPDTPYSKTKPGIGMTIRHGRKDSNQYIRLIFPAFEDLRKFISEIINFTLQTEKSLTDTLAEAEKEWNAMREKSLEAKVSRLEMTENGQKPIMS